MFKHIGSSENKALIEITVLDLTINISTPNCDVIVVFERGGRKVQTQPMRLINKAVNFNGTVLRLPATLYYDMKKRAYQEKKGSLIILIKYERGLKQAGLIDLDFASYLNQRIAHKQERLLLQGCPDKEATLAFVVNFLSQEEKRSKTPDAAITQIRDQQSKEQIDKLRRENQQLKQQIQVETPTSQDEQLQQPRQPMIKQDQQDQQKEIQQIKLLTEENNILKEKLIDMEQLVDAQKEQRKDIQELRSKLQMQTTQMIEYREHIEELEHDVGRLEREKQEQHREVEELHDHMAKLTTKYSLLENEYQIVSNERVEYEKSVDELSRQYDVMEKSLLKQKEKFAQVMHEFLCYGDYNVIEILEKYTQE